MATASKNFSRFTPTENELSKLSDALKSEEFRRLVCQYAKDLNHPENRARYEAEIVQFEAERGVECTFLHPDPGYVIKTTNLRNDEKVFVNVCSDPSVDKPQSKKAVSSGIGSAGAGGVEWSIPYSQSGQARRENDRQGRPCSVYDVIFHPDALALANRSGRLKHLVTETALEAVEKAAPTLVKLEHHNLKFPKMKFKGAFQPTVIRKPLPKEKTKKRPEHSLKFRHHVTDLPKAAAAVGRGVEDPCRPSELVVEIHLPELDSAQGVELDILERQLTLESSTPLAAAEYSLTVPFPYPVEEDKGSAKFEKSTKKLIVVAPVKADPHETIHRLVSTDSGIEMDPAFALEDEEVEDDEHDQERRKSSPASKTPSSGGEQEKREDLLFPSYSCNIYEGLMIFTLDVKHVSESSLIKTSMIEEDFGFSLKFSSVGKGMVPFHYGFYCALVIPEEDRCRLIKDPLESIEVEVWDNNVIVKVSLPKGQRAPCHQYKVGSNPDDLTLHSLPQLRAFRKRKEEKLGNVSVGSGSPLNYQNKLLGI